MISANDPAGRRGTESQYGRRGAPQGTIIGPMSQHLHLDPFSGVAGDMFLGALVDLGVDMDAVRAALADLPIDRPYRITADRVSRHGIGAVDLKVHVGDSADPSHSHQPHDQGHRHGHGHANAHGDGHGHTPPPHRLPRDHGDGRATRHDRRAVGSGRGRWSTLWPRPRRGCTTRRSTTSTFTRSGAVDSIVDMLGGVVALELLEIDSLSCGVLPISSGLVRCDHGVMPVPAPATAYLLEGLPTMGVDRRGELITPTGAALVRALCGSFGPPPAMIMRGVGYGAGDRDSPDVPNLLRVFIGERMPQGKLTTTRVALDQSVLDSVDVSPSDLAGHPHNSQQSHNHRHDHDHDHKHDHSHAPSPPHRHPATTASDWIVGSRGKTVAVGALTFHAIVAAGFGVGDISARRPAV